MSQPTTEELGAIVESIAAPIVEERGGEIYDIDVRRQGRAGSIRVSVDRAGGTAPGSGITVGEVAEIARRLAHALEADERVSFNYELEVSSPGVERTLRTERHFELNVGRDVRLVLGGGESPGAVIEGRLESVSDGVAMVRSGDAVTPVSVSSVRRGRTVFDFSAAARSGRDGDAQQPGQVSGADE